MSRELRKELERLGAELARERAEAVALRETNTGLLVRVQAVEAERDRWKLRAKTMNEAVERVRVHAELSRRRPTNGCDCRDGCDRCLGRVRPAVRDMSSRPRPPPTPIPSSGTRISL